MSASARSAAGSAAARFRAEVEGRLGELVVIMKAGFELLDDYEEVIKKPLKSSVLGRAKAISNLGSEAERAEKAGRLAVCLRQVNRALAEVREKWGLVNVAIGGNATAASKRNCIKALGEFCYEYLKLWVVLASFMHDDTAESCGGVFKRLKEFGAKANTFYNEISKGDSAITYFNRKKTMILEEEEAAVIVRYFEALEVLDIMNKMPRVPGHGGGGRTRKGRKATRKGRKGRRGTRRA